MVVVTKLLFPEQDEGELETDPGRREKRRQRMDITDD
jgi:hypothetical protein